MPTSLDTAEFNKLRKTKQVRDLQALFNPKSIAIIGASERGFYPANLLRNLLKYKYEGEVFPVNPRRETVQGLRSYPKILDIESDIDLAVVIVPRGFVLDILHQCVEKSVKAAIIVSAGFGEADNYGKQLQTRLVQFAKKSRIVICGPNSAGLVNMHESIALTARLDPAPILGNVAVVSQSGALMMALFGDFRDKLVGLSYIVSTGNQVDVDVSECMRYMIDDKNTRVVAAFIEGLKDVDNFLETADLALREKKPIVVLKVGRTAAGAVAARTHTGSLTGSDEVYDAVFKQKGIIRVDDVDDLVNSAKLFSQFVDRLPKGDGIGIISQSGGLASLTADICETLGLNLPELSAVTLKGIESMDELLTFGSLMNPADVRGAGTRATPLHKLVKLFVQDKRISVVGILLARPAVGKEDLETVSTIIDLCKVSKKPIFVVWVGRKIPDPKDDLDRQPYRLLEKGGVPIFRNPSSALKAVKHLIDYTKIRERYLSSQAGIK